MLQQLRHSPAEAAQLAVLAGSLADWGSVSPFLHSSSSAPPPSVSPPPVSVVPAVEDKARGQVRVQLSANF